MRLEPMEAEQQVKKRIDRWVRLKQMTYFASKDYTFSLRTDHPPHSATLRSQVVVQIGDRAWAGNGRGENEMKAVDAALKNAKLISLGL